MARAYTITCSRWETVAFSAEYLHAGQRLLVSLDSPVAAVTDLDGLRVCATAGTTTIARLEDMPGVEAIPGSTHTNCLVKFQQRLVDAISADDMILAGLASQDPYAKVFGDSISDEPYGVAARLDAPDLVRFVNGVLEDRIADGTWKASYDEWFHALGDAPTPPTPVYGRTP